MKNLTAALKTGDLRPKERALLLVHNHVAKEKTGKEILTPAEKHAVVEGWRPDTNEQAREYNRYNEGWQMEGCARLDAQTIYLNSEISLLQAGRILDYAMWRDYKDTGKGVLSSLRTMTRGIDEDEALTLVIQNSGLEFDRVVYRCAFLNLSEAVKRDILTLAPDSETENQYLDQEEILATLFDGKKRLSPEAKERLAGLIVEALHNKYVDAIEKKGLKTSEWWFSGFYAELPTLEIAKKWAQYSGIPCDADDETLGDALTERMQNYADEHKTSVRDLLETTVCRWLNEGLFVEEYSPIWNSSGKVTCNDADTKLSHKDIFKAWLKAKTEAKAMMQKLVDENKLRVESREKEFLGFKEAVQIITGESLRDLEGDYPFAEDFRKQADDLRPLGVLILYLRKEDLLEGYASLLAFADMYKKLSKIYEIDLGYKITAWIDNLKRQLELVNIELQRIESNLTEAIYLKHKAAFSIEIFMSDLLLHPEETKPGAAETETHYADEFTKLLGDEF